MLPSISPNALQTRPISSVFGAETMLVAFRELNQNLLGGSGNPILFSQWCLLLCLKLRECKAELEPHAQSQCVGIVRGEVRWLFLGLCLADRPQCLISVAAVLG